MTNREKAYFQFNRGLNTEASLLSFPEGFSTDEQNFDLDINGSRRRRRGLQLESSGSNYTLPASSYSPGDVVRSFKWENVAGDSSLNFIVVQAGYYLHFYRDLSATSGSVVISSNKLSISVDLRNYRTSGASDYDIATNPVDIAYGRGHAFVVQKYVNPFWIQYDTAVSSITITPITIRERDFEGINDGYSNTAQPLSAIESHTYNLLNRGWKEADIGAYQTAKSKQPSKAMVPYLGYRRATTSGVAEQDWTKAFSADKLDAELWQDAPAPTGHFIRNPFNTAQVQLPGASNQLAIETWSISGTSPGTQTVTIETSGNHGLSASDSVEISGLYGFYSSSSVLGTFPDFYFPTFGLEGSYTVASAPSTDSITISVTFPSDFLGWIDQYASLGTLNNNLVANASGYLSSVRPKAVAFFAGRVWYAGTNHPRLASRIFFSQVIESDAQYGKCYQVADPTDERLPDLVPTDGGVIVIPEIADVVDIMDYGQVLLIFATNGVWMIGAGAGGYFSATSYSIRKITDQGVVGPASIVLAENTPFYWSYSDIFALVQDPNSGYLMAQNVSSLKVNRLINDVPQGYKRTIQGCYDDLNKRVVWLYGHPDGDIAPTDYQYNFGLTYDLRLQAFVKYKFTLSASAYLAGVFATKGSVSASSENKVKYLGVTELGTALTVSEARNSTDFTDWGVAEPEAYVVTGFETLQDPSRVKFAPYVHVFNYKTETGYSVVGDEYTPIGASSVLLQARWNWADLSASGKWGSAWETYRRQRLYSPADPTTDSFDDGYPLVWTRNRVRGSGRSLHLKFSAGAGKDAHIAGWKVDYELTRVA